LLRFSTKGGIQDVKVVPPFKVTLQFNRLAMPFGNINIYLRESFQFSFVTVLKISPLWKPEIYLFRHFESLSLRISMKKILFNFSPKNDDAGT